jgi:hypothetical protein
VALSFAPFADRHWQSRPLPGDSLARAAEASAVSRTAAVLESLHIDAVVQRLAENGVPAPSSLLDISARHDHRADQRGAALLGTTRHTLRFVAAQGMLPGKMIARSCCARKALMNP